MDTVVVILLIVAFIALCLFFTPSDRMDTKHDIFVRSQFRARIYTRIRETEDRPLRIEIPDNITIKSLNEICVNTNYELEPSSFIYRAKWIIIK
jgi:hypothetical protein